MRVTPENITSLQPNEVFVFASNLAGRHGKGAAKQAMKFGAKYGQAFGLQGQTYAIPTLDAYFQKRPIEDIQRDVNDFILEAALSHEKIFLVTEIGCGLAGFSVEEIAPLFKGCTNVDNIHLPKRFWEILKP